MNQSFFSTFEAPLINYWPMSNLSDMVGGADMYGGANYTFTYDRFCSLNAAIYLNRGYLQVPPGIYFCGDFTTIFWIQNKIEIASDVRVLDFTNLLSGGRDDDITHFIQANTRYPTIEIWNRTSLSLFRSSYTLRSNTWYHIAFVSKKGTVSTFINGTKVASKTGMFEANCVNRTYNRFGGMIWNNNVYINAILDDMKIYKGALSENQILNDFTLSSSNGSISLSIFFSILKIKYFK